MKKFLLLLSLFFVCFLSACQTTSHAVENNEPQNSAAADANVKLAMAFLKEGAMRDAKEKLLQAEHLDPKNPAVWYSFGYYYESTGCRDQAREAYLKAIKVSPHDGAAHNNYGTFLCRCGEYEESLKHFLLAVSDPQYLEMAGAYENAGLCCLKIPDLPRARNFFQKALAQDPNLASSQFYLAELAYKQNNLNEAKLYLMQSALAANPNKQILQLVTQVSTKLHDPQLLSFYKLKAN